MASLVTVLLLMTLQTAGSLGRELLARDLPVPKDAAELELPITSYSVLDDEHGFVIAYYLAEPDNSLHELRVRSFNKATRTWRLATFVEPIGSILSIKRNGSYLYVTGHSSPSATPLLVLFADSLALKRELDGWPVLMLRDGRVVFARSMVHFAPAHAEVLALYDPLADRERTLYPPDVENTRGIEYVPGTRLFVDRSFDGVKTGRAPGTIQFTAIVQSIRVNQDDIGQPASEKTRVFVTCHVAADPPTCLRRE